MAVEIGLQLSEGRTTALIQDHGFAVEHGRPNAQAADSISYGGAAIRPVVAVAVRIVTLPSATADEMR